MGKVTGEKIEELYTGRERGGDGEGKEKTGYGEEHGRGRKGLERNEET